MPHNHRGSGTDIQSLWPLLDAATRQWFMDHIGATIVPRKITAELCEGADQPLPQDAQGQLLLTGDDMVFIRNRAHSAFAAHGTDRFFEAVQPKNHSDIPKTSNPGPHPSRKTNGPPGI